MYCILKWVIAISILLSTLFFVVPFTLGQSTQPNMLMCGHDRQWRRLECQYPKDNPPCFGEVVTSVCWSGQNPYSGCMPNPNGLLCCGHPDPYTGLPYPDSDEFQCNPNGLPNPSPEMVKAIKQYSREVYTSNCRGGYTPSGGAGL